MSFEFGNNVKWDCHRPAICNWYKLATRLMIMLCSSCLVWPIGLETSFFICGEHRIMSFQRGLALTKRRNRSQDSGVGIHRLNRGLISICYARKGHLLVRRLRNPRYSWDELRGPDSVDSLYSYQCMNQGRGGFRDTLTSEKGSSSAYQESVEYPRSSVPRWFPPLSWLSWNIRHSISKFLSLANWMISPMLWSLRET